MAERFYDVTIFQAEDPALEVTVLDYPELDLVTPEPIVINMNLVGN